MVVVAAVIAGGVGAAGGWWARTAAQGTPAAGCVAGTPAEHAALVQRYFDEVYNAQNLAVVDELLTDDFGRSNPALPHDNLPGNDDDVRRVAEWLESFPDLRITVDDIVAVDDRVAVRLTWTGTQQGALAQWGIPATGRRASWQGVVIYRTECGQLRENWVALDYLTLFRQLGVITDDELASVGDPSVATPAP